MIGGKTTFFEVIFHHILQFISMFAFNQYIVCIIKVNGVSKNAGWRNEKLHQVRSYTGIKNGGKRGDNREKQIRKEKTMVLFVPFINDILLL